LTKTRNRLLRIGGSIVILCFVFYFLSLRTRTGPQQFVIRLSGSAGTRFSGSYDIVANGKSESHKIEGVVPAEYPVTGNSLSVLIQKNEVAGNLTLEVRQNGTVVRVAGTSMPGGTMAANIN